MKTLAIRLDDRLHAQLAVVAQLEETSITEVIRLAVEAYVAERRSNPELTAKATGLLQAIDAETLARKQAIEALLEGEATEPQPTEAKEPKRSRRQSPPAQ